MRPTRVDPSGERGPTKSQAVGPRWRRTSRGFYVPADVDVDVPEQRILEASMRLPEGGAVTGWAACRLLGANFFDGLGRDGVTTLPVPLCLADRGQLKAEPGVVRYRDRLDPAEVVRRAGIPCATPVRALFDVARYAPSLREAVVAIDMMAAAELVSIRQLTDYVSGKARWRGVPLVRRALRLASEHSRSPNETRMRLVWLLDAGLPSPLVNQPVFDRSGRLLGIADLLDAKAGVVGEYDGADHRTARRHSRDVARSDRFRRAGLEYFTITGPDLADRRLMVRRMQATRDRAAWLSESERAWTLEPPFGSGRELSLDERLEHRAWEIAVYEQHERELAG